jgi:cell division protein FtsL
MASSIDFSKAMMTRNTNPFVYGNAAPVHVPEPEVQEEPVRKKTAPERRKRPARDYEAERQEKLNKRRIHRASKVNFLYTLGVSAIVITMFVLCVQYLDTQSEVQGNQTAVQELQSQLNDLKTTNDETELKINTDIDYELIYDTAVNELGMIYPDRDQVITYDSTISEYVKQYKDIPQK